MKPLKVLTIGHSYVVSLNRGIVREVAEDPDFDVTVAAPAFFHGDLRPLEAEPEPPGSKLKLELIRTRFDKAIHIFRYNNSELRTVVTKAGGFDVIHAWEEPYVFAGFQIARAVEQTGARFCFRTAQSYVKRYPPPFGMFERRVRNRAQGWIAGASLVYDAMLKRGYPADSGRILNLAVDMGSFRPLTIDQKADVLRELGLQPENPIIGYVGRLTVAKGLPVLMEAINQLPPQPWNLLLLGSGELQRDIENWAQSRGWQNRVRILLAKHADVPRYLGAMDLLVAPSQTMKNWREQFGRMLVEAFACGVPVIGSDSGEIPHVIGSAGLVVHESDAHAWAQAIDSLLKNPAKRAELSRLGFERAPKFSTKAIGGMYKDYYRWLASQQVLPAK